MIAVPSLAAIRSALESQGRGPRRSYGQHFLTDPAVLSRIVDAAKVAPGEVVLEVGPGPGVLTATLINRGARVVAVEADAGMVALLRTLLGDPHELEILDEDVLIETPAPSRRVRERIAAALGVDEPAIAGRYALVANLPYQIATPLLLDVFASAPPRCAVVMIQREVADRLRARPGEDAYGLASVLLAFDATVEEVFRLRPGAFWPPPKVDSSCVKVTPREVPLVRAETRDFACGIVRAAFAERRKTLVNSVARRTTLVREDIAAALIRIGLDVEIRAEKVAPEQFVALSSILETSAGASAQREGRKVRE